jgi:hypothetical protein
MAGEWDDLSHHTALPQERVSAGSKLRSGRRAGVTDNLPEVVDVRRGTTGTAERAEFRQHAVVPNERHRVIDRADDLAVIIDRGGRGAGEAERGNATVLENDPFEKGRRRNLRRTNDAAVRADPGGTAMQVAQHGQSTVVPNERSRPGNADGREAANGLTGIVDVGRVRGHGADRTQIGHRVWSRLGLRPGTFAGEPGSKNKRQQADRAAGTGNRHEVTFRMRLIRRASPRQANDMPPASCPVSWRFHDWSRRGSYET